VGEEEGVEEEVMVEVEARVAAAVP